MLIFNVVKGISGNKIGMVQYPSFITFIITWDCNGRCIFCDVWKKRNKDQDLMSSEEIENIFRQLKKIDVLRITGGEPFLRNDISEIVNRIEKVNAPEIIHFSTNGFLTDRIIKTMEEIRPIEKIHIKVSIDSVGEKQDNIRGVKGAYEKAMKTVKELVKLKEFRKFHVGVNQAIIDENEIESYFNLKDILEQYSVPIYPSIAFDPTNGLYSDLDIVDPDLSFQTFGKFSEEKLTKFMKILLEDGKKINNIQEPIVDRYHLKGLYNRMVKSRHSPNPKCVALNNHLRLLPNGDVPVCIYNGRVVGNLRKQSFKSI